MFVEHLENESCQGKCAEWAVYREREWPEPVSCLGARSGQTFSRGDECGRPDSPSPVWGLCSITHLEGENEHRKT